MPRYGTTTDTDKDVGSALRAVIGCLDQRTGIAAEDSGSPIQFHFHQSEETQC